MAPVTGRQRTLITRKKKNLPHTDFWHAELVCCRFVARKKVAGSPKVKLCITFDDKCTPKKHLAKTRGG